MIKHLISCCWRLGVGGRQLPALVIIGLLDRTTLRCIICFSLMRTSPSRPDGLKIQNTTNTSLRSQGQKKSEKMLKCLGDSKNYFRNVINKSQNFPEGSNPVRGPTCSWWHKGCLRLHRFSVSVEETEQNRSRLATVGVSKLWWNGKVNVCSFERGVKVNLNVFGASC